MLGHKDCRLQSSDFKPTNDVSYWDICKTINNTTFIINQYSIHNLGILNIRISFVISFLIPMLQCAIIFLTRAPNLDLFCMKSIQFLHLLQ